MGYEGTYLTVSPASGSGTGSPAGSCVFNQTQTFTTLDGTLQQQLTGLSVTNIILNNSSKGAVYAACTLGQTSRGRPETLYLANSAGGVEAYDSYLNPVTLGPGAFGDPSVPAGFTPYGIYTDGGKVSTCLPVAEQRIIARRTQ